MKQEEKAKRYDEALEKAKSKIKNDKDHVLYEDDIIEIFPELKESEDERIRKELIAFLKENHETGMAEKTWSLSGLERWIAWLSKKCEQKSTLSGEDKRMWKLIKKYAHYNISDLALEADHVTREQLESWLEKQGEQVSAIRWYDASFIPQEMKELLVEWNSSDATWHDVAFYHADTKTFLNYERELKNVTRWCYVDDLFLEQSNVKETGISQHDEKTCVEWSEEDEVILDEIIDFFGNGTVKLQHDLSLYASWLKSLKQRCIWKPSDEQMDALQYVCRNLNPPLSDKLGWDSLKTLELLYKILKKLY